MKTQDLSEIEIWHNSVDPWGYENNPHDKKRKEILLSEIPQKKYTKVLDIGCGQGFVTKDLPGDIVIGTDISKNAVENAKRLVTSDRICFYESNLFELESKFDKGSFDLIIITGVIYPHYVGKSNSLIFSIIDNLLARNGILISVHINEWYKTRFPFLLLDSFLYNYREYIHKFEKYIK